MTATRTPMRLLVTLFGVVIVLLHCLAIFLPSGANWGFHHLAFLSPLVAVPIVLLMIAALVPQIQNRAFSLVEGLTARRKALLWVVSLITFALLFWLFRQRTFFLGDGYLVIRNLSGAHNVAVLPAPFPTSPLSAFLAYHLKEVLTSLHLEPSGQLAWQIQSIIFGLMAIPIAFRLARTLSNDSSLHWVLALFIVAGGASQLFFGYAETYPPAYVATMLFLWLSLEYMVGRVSLYLPFISFGLLFAFHFGMLSLIPALCVLFVLAIRRQGVVRSLLAVVATMVFTALILWICGYTPANFAAVVLKGGSYFLPVTTPDNWQAAYSLLSFWHLVDLINAFMLFSPFVILLVPLALIWVLERGLRWKPETLFLSLTFVGAIGWMFMTNFEVGMSRDWDVLAPLSVCITVFVLYGLHYGADEAQGKRHLLFGMALVTLLHTVPWVLVNADEDRSIARFAMLQDGRLRSQRAVAYACEDLAGFYRDRKQYAEALPFLEKAVAIDSTNARRWLSLANIYQLADQKENALHAYEESARHGIRDKAAFFNLGVLYYNHQRLDEAIAMLQRAAAVDSTDTLISSNLGIMIAKRASSASLKK